MRKRLKSFHSPDFIQLVYSSVIRNFPLKMSTTNSDSDSSSSHSSLSSSSSSGSGSSCPNYHRRHRSRYFVTSRIKNDQKDISWVPKHQKEQVETQTLSNSRDVTKFQISCEKSEKLRNLVSFGLSDSKARAIRNRFNPKFDGGSFSLCIPEMDEAIYLELQIVKRSSASKEKIDRNEAELRGVQNKVLDVIRPLLFIWNSSKDRQIRKAVKTAIYLWAHAHFSMTALRRKNVLKQTHPTFISLMKKNTNFDEKQYGTLFGDAFIDMMVKVAKDKNALKEKANHRNGQNAISVRNNHVRGGNETGQRGHLSYHRSEPSNQTVNSAIEQDGYGPNSPFQNQQRYFFLNSIPEKCCAQSKASYICLKNGYKFLEPYRMFQAFPK